MCFFPAILNWDGSGGRVFNIPISPHAAFCSQCGILSMTTSPTLPPPLHSRAPRPVQIHLHPLMISVKNCWHHMRQGGGRRLIWIKLDRRVDTALKVSRPFMLRWQGVCVLGGGRHGVAKEAYLKAGVYLRQGSEKKWTTKLVILQIRPVTSSLFPFHAGGGYIKWGLNAMAWPAERAAENKTRGLKSRS